MAHAPDSSPTSAPPTPQIPRAEPIPPSLRVSAAGRLVGGEGPSAAAAARRFVRSAGSNGVDLALMCGTLERDGSGAPIAAREVCLGVIGAGRTAMIFVSAPTRNEAPQRHAERVESIRALCGRLSRLGTLAIAQGLTDPDDDWAVGAFTDAGFIWVGDLAYVRRPLPGAPVGPGPDAWPDGVQVRPVGTVERGGRDRALLGEAMERSYERTLDCPELCGLRETDDVIESHRSSGRWEPGLWWLVLHNDRPAGCVLLNPCPDQKMVELVYIGLAPELRGLGLGRRLLEMGIGRVRSGPYKWFSCAVDRRNEPALRLYRSLGFAEFARRRAFVRAV
jgi:GNAT superfamily N-acetyltransferase